MECPHCGAVNDGLRPECTACGRSLLTTPEPTGISEDALQGRIERFEQRFDPLGGEDAEPGAESSVPPLPAEPQRHESTRSDTRTWMMLAHASALAGFVFPLGNILGPLVVWMVKRDEDPAVGVEAKEALNFNISWTLWLIGLVVAGVVLLIVLVGILVLIAAGFMGLAWLVLVIMATIRAADGQTYRYPLTQRFVQ